MAGELVTLAEAAGQAVVTTAATDLWGKAKAGFALLLGRGDLGKTHLAERRLEETRSPVDGSSKRRIRGRSGTVGRRVEVAAGGSA